LIVVNLVEKNSDVEETQQGECENNHDNDEIVFCELKIDKKVLPCDQSGENV
jgi:hypothetical protein